MIADVDATEPERAHFYGYADVWDDDEDDDERSMGFPDPARTVRLGRRKRRARVRHADLRH